jgi:hypothetical protein
MIDVEGLRAAIADAIEALTALRSDLSPAGPTKPIGDPPPDDEDDDDDEEDEKGGDEHEDKAA